MYRSRVQTPHECALAAEIFNHFCSAGTMKQILALHGEICNILGLKSARLPDFYPQLKAKLVSSWQAQAVFKKLDTRANHKVYAKGKACPNTRVLIIGAGPCGLRAAIECQLLGAKVVVMEKRDRMSRNNVLHLWPFVINDLRGLGAKKFFGKFCAGSIDHISIRQLQCILLKVCLLLGVEFYEGVSFEELLEPTAADKENNDVVGWRARVEPAEHPVSEYEFDVLLGADGKRNTLRGFKRKEFRGKLAIAITANFINRHSEQEAAVPEISGVAFIFNQKFFKDLFKETGIDLENIVYYKDDTHYFVMTAKKTSLINKGVILRDYAETSRLLSADNVDRNALLQYANEAAQFSTKGLLPRMDFALNHYGEPDIALFDFTSMYAAENASMVLERCGYRLLCGLVGDSLLEPFWPTGSGCARGFLSAMDAAWSVRQWGQAPPPHPLLVIAERESIYRLLGQTTPENLQRNLGVYTLEPSSRYPNLNTESVTPHRVASFYYSDEPLPLDVAVVPKKRARGPLTSEEGRRLRKRRSTRPSPQEEQLLAQAEATLRRERERVRSQHDYTKKMNEPNQTNDKPTRTLADEEWVPEGRSSRKRRSPFSSKKVSIDDDESPDEIAKWERIGKLPIEDMEAEMVKQAKHFILRQLHKTPKNAVGKLSMEHYERRINPQHKPKRLAEEEWLPEYSRKRNVSHRKKVGNSQQERALSLKVNRMALDELAAISRDRLELDDEEIPDILAKRPSLIGKLPIKDLERVLTSKIKPVDSVRPERMHKRKVAREIAKRHFERSLQLLAASPVYQPSQDLENDVGLQQYRAAAPEFGERVKQLERRLLQTEEPHQVGGAGGGGARSGRSRAISRLVAELAGSGEPAAPRTNKPQDLLRAVGRIESGDWNVKQIERKIHENKMGRPEPRAAEKVPKWDKKQFLERQNRVGGAGEGVVEERWGELDETLKQLDQKLRDSGRPTLGTQKVAKLADRFVKKAEPEPERPVEPPPGKTWTPAAAATVATAAARCAACGARVFAAESVVADGLHLHRSCFRCAVCRAALRPGSYTMEKNGTRLVCLRHGASVPDGAVTAERRRGRGSRLAAETPERIVLDVSDDGAREMDEDEWTDRNFLASATSCTGELSDEEDSSEDEEFEEAGGGSGVSAGEAGEAAEHAGRGAAGDGPGERDDDLSDDSNGYDTFSDDSADSSGAESSRLREAREARRREVPPAHDAAALYRGTDSSEVESEEESSITESEASSATRVSTDSEFDITYKIPPAITVTEAPVRPAPPPSPPVYRPPPPQPPSEYPLSRTRSAGGIATKRALELKRRYLLGESASPSIRRSDSTSILDNKIESFQSNISQFQKLLNPATPEQARKPNPIFCRMMSMSEVNSNVDRSLVEFTEEPDSLNTIDKAVDLSSCLLNSVESNSVRDSVIEVDVNSRINGSVIDLDKTKDSIQNTVIDLDSTVDSIASSEHITSADSPQWQMNVTIDLDTTEEKITDTSPQQGAINSDVIEDPGSDNSSAQENTLNELDYESLSDSSSTARSSLPKQNTSIHKTGSNQQIPRLEVHNDSGEVILSDSPDVSEWAGEGLDDYPKISRGTKALSGPKNLDNIESVHICGKESSFMNEIEYLEFVDDDSEATKSIKSPITSNTLTQRNDKPNSPTKETIALFNDAATPRITYKAGEISFSTLMSFVVRTPAPAQSEITSPVTDIETFQVSSPITHNFDKFLISSPVASNLKSSPISSPVTPNLKSSPISSPLTSNPKCSPISSPVTSNLNCSPTTSPVTSNPKSSPITSPVTPVLSDKTSKKEEIKRERENQTELVKRMVLERIGSTNSSGRKRRPRVLPSGSFPPPVPPAPIMPSPPARPPPPVTLTPSASDPELARVRRQRGIVHTVTEFFNKRLSPRNKWASDTEIILEQRQCASTISVLGREPPAATAARSCDCVSAGGAPARRHSKGRAWVTRRL